VKGRGDHNAMSASRPSHGQRVEAGASLRSNAGGAIELDQYRLMV